MTWANESDLLAEMDSWTPLPGEDDPRWDQADPPGPLWQQAQRLLDAAYACGERRWQRAAVRVFEFAADWPLHGMMQSLRHGPERAFGGPGGSAELARLLEPLTRHPRAGTRLWVAAELGILRQVDSLPALVALTEDELGEVADEARLAIAMLAQEHVDAELACLQLGIAPPT